MANAEPSCLLLDAFTPAALIALRRPRGTPVFGGSGARKEASKGLGQVLPFVSPPEGPPSKHHEITKTSRKAGDELRRLKNQLSVRGRVASADLPRHVRTKCNERNGTDGF